MYVYTYIQTDVGTDKVKADIGETENISRK